MILHGQQRTIKVIPRFGLGNRLMAIASAIRLQEIGEFNNVVIQCEPNSHFNAPIDLLGIENVTIVHHQEKDDIYAGLPQDHKIQSCDRVTVEAFDIFTVDTDTTDPHTIRKEIIKALKRVKFQPKYHRIADQYKVENCIGLHCRRSDYPFSQPIMSDDKLSRYHDLLDKKFAADIQQQYQGPYFLASDSEKTNEFFKHKIPGIIQASKSNYPNWSTRSTRAVEEGIVDMILLSRCTKIIADSQSTFSTVSAWLGNIEKLSWARPKVPQ